MRNNNVRAVYSALMPDDRISQRTNRLEKLMADAAQKEKAKWLGRIMKKVLKLGTASGIDEGYKRAISDVSGAIAEEIEKL
jgi:hypothetical protein